MFRGDSTAAMAPLLAAVEESGIMAAGSGAMEAVLGSMEQRLEGVLDRAEGEIRQIDYEGESRTLSLATETRRLVEQTTTLAITYEAMLAMLDDAERALDGITDAARTR
jgi:hypothetical protein